MTGVTIAGRRYSDVRLVNAMAVKVIADRADIGLAAAHVDYATETYGRAA